MLIRCIRSEALKLRHSAVWLLFFLLPLISAAYGTFNYLQNLEILTDGWHSLWTQHTLFYALFFYPALVGLYAAYLWRLEHRGHNWNCICSVPVRRIDLFLAKYLTVLRLVLLTQGYVYLLYLLCGKGIVHLPGWPPVQAALYLLRGTLGGCAVIGMQLLLSMCIRSFAVPVFLAVLGGISGMLALSGGRGLWWPYALMQLGMNANRSEDLLAGEILPFLLACLWQSALPIAAAWGYLRKKDIRG